MKRIYRGGDAQAQAPAPPEKGKPAPEPESQVPVAEKKEKGKEDEKESEKIVTEEMIFYFLWIIFFDSHKLALKFQHYLEECLQL